MFSRGTAPDRLMSPALKGSKIMASPMRMRTAAAGSAMGGETTGVVSSRWPRQASVVSASPGCCFSPLWPFGSNRKLALFVCLLS